MITKLKAIIFAFLFVAPSAFAGYTTMTIEGVQQANGVWTTAGVMDSMGFVRTTGAVSVMGTTRNLPVTLAADVSASSTLLKGASRALGPIALAATAYDLYSWYTSNGLVNSSGSWAIGTGQFTFNSASDGYVDCSYLGGNKTTVSNCFALYKKVYPNNFFVGPLTLDPSLRPNPYCSQSICTYRFYQEANSKPQSLVFDILWPSSRPEPPYSNSRPATDDDFAKLPQIPIPLISSSWSKFPNLAGKTPITSTSFSPYSEWLGSPYFKDGNWYRDRMDISPCPTSSQPTRVCIDIGPQKFEGATDPQTVPSQATGTATGSTTKEPTDFCKANPQSIACSELGELEDENLEVDERPVDVSYTPWGSSNSQCPADKIIPLWDSQSISLSYSPICQFASLLRPLVIALAFVAAGFIVAGITRKGGGDA